MRSGRLTPLLGVATVALVVIAAPSLASTPPSHSVTVPTQPGETVTVSWEGTLPPGANLESECTVDPTGLTEDHHAIELAVPEGTYDNVTVTAVFTIDPAPEADAIATVFDPEGTPHSTDQGFVDTAESVVLNDPIAGSYDVVACPFANAVPSPYTGTLELTAAERSAEEGPVATCDAPSEPPTFSEPAYVDTERAGGEPMIHTHPDGTLLYGSHAGTTHFYSPEIADEDSAAFVQHYRGQAYIYWSDDNGGSWNFVDRTLPPSGVPNSGFSDPDFAIDAAGNVYFSEINLVNVALSRSTDSGRSFELRNFFAQTMTDRQWKEAGPEDVVFIVGNAFAGGTFPTDPAGHLGHTIYRSTDGGATFSRGISDPGGLGDLRYDHTTDTLYEAHLSEGALRMAAFRDPLNEDLETALAPEVNTIAEGVDMLSHWPAFHLDPSGNLYLVWDEGGDGNRPAGVWYAYSDDAGRTWSDPIRVDPDDRTDIWPWIAVGDEGRVGIAWFGTNEALPDHNAERADEDNPWHVYVAQTLNGLGCTDSAVPGFTVVQATPEPFHVGTICQGGTICQAQLVDRRLGDYFSIEVDGTGALVAAYSDTRQGGSVALPAFFRQTGGASFFADGDGPGKGKGGPPFDPPGPPEEPPGKAKGKQSGHGCNPNRETCVR